MLGDITAPEPGNKEDSEASVSEKSEAPGLPDKGALCKRGHRNGHCHHRAATKLAGLSPVSPIVCSSMFPARGLNESPGSESQAVARSGGSPRLLGKQSPPAEEWAPCEREGALPGRGWELQSPQLWDSSCAPGSSSPQPTRLGVGPLGKLRESLACSGRRRRVGHSDLLHVSLLAVSAVFGLAKRLFK